MIDDEIDFTTVLLDALEDNASTILLLYFVAFLAWKEVPVSHKESIFAQRLYWKEYCSTHVARRTFKRRLRMSKSSFDNI